MNSVLIKHTQSHSPLSHRYLFDENYVVLTKNVVDDPFWNPIIDKLSVSKEKIEGTGVMHVIIKNNGRDKKVSMFIMFTWTNIISFHPYNGGSFSNYDIGSFIRYSSKMIRSIHNDYKLLNTANFKVYFYSSMERIDKLKRLGTKVSVTALKSNVKDLNEFILNVKFDPQFDLIHRNPQIVDVPASAPVSSFDTPAASGFKTDSKPIGVTGLSSFDVPSSVPASSFDTPADSWFKTDSKHIGGTRTDKGSYFGN